MANSKINLQGAVDLGALAAARKAQEASSAARATAPDGIIFDVTEMTFEPEVIHRSQSLPVVVNFWSPRSQGSQVLSPLLEKLTAEQRGKVLLAHVEADSNPRLVQAFQLQTVPAVFLVIAGQVQPLFTNTVPEDQLRPLFAEIVKAAEQAGLVGAVAEDENPAESEAETPVDPRFQAAYDAINEGNWDAAEAAFTTVLNANPADDDAKAGLANVGLMRRTETLDFDAVALISPTNQMERLAKADALMLLGQAVEAYAVLVEGVAMSAAEEREAYKTRLLEFFILMGDSDDVRAARRALTNALF